MDGWIRDGKMRNQCFNALFSLTEKHPMMTKEKINNQNSQTLSTVKSTRDDVSRSSSSSISWKAILVDLLNLN